MRAVMCQAGFKYVIRHKDDRRVLGGDGVRAVNKRDPDRKKPDRVFRRRDGQRIDVWEQFEVPGGRRTVVFQKFYASHAEGSCVTNLPAEVASSEAVTTLMMERWSEENTGFHELAGQLNLDRAYVHKKKPNAVWTVVALALIGYNAWQAYLYKVLRLDPLRPARTWADLRFDMWVSLGSGQRCNCCEPRATGPP